jgi:5-hydroxyisourate hydrolase
VSSSISTHVLDTAAGRPAAAVRVELFHGDALLGTGATDDDGRIGSLYEDMEAGTYRLVFHPPSPLFRRVELELELDGSSHYHVPLLLSPFACTIYRGS